MSEQISGAPAASQPLLSIRDLRVEFSTSGGAIKAVRGVNMQIAAGQCVAVVGESGCGKSVTAKAILQLLPKNGRITGGEIIFAGENLLDKDERQMQQLRGKDIGMIFQDPMTSLNPTMTVGKQISEALLRHQPLSKAEAKERTVEFLRLVGVAYPEKRYGEYPDSLSGGLRQRVVVAMAMCCQPRLLLADEPTTALDVTIQAQILDLMRQLRQRFNTAIILITHDLGVVANMAERVLVFYAGQVVEEGLAEDVFYRPRHPYTWGLLKSMPRLNSDKQEELLSIEGAPPDLFAPPLGCAFAPRCPYALPLCREREPEMGNIQGSHLAACWLNHPQTSREQRPAWMSSSHVSQADFD